MAETHDIISDVGHDYLRLHLVSGIGATRLRRLVGHFGSTAAVLEASSGDLQRVDGIGRRQAESIVAERHADTVDHEIERAAACGVRILCIEDDHYPQPLRNMTDPPCCLYVKGDLQATDAVAVAVVGTRRCSHYGQEQSLRFGQSLATAGFTVVSGLALGIDGEAHRGALRAGGRTIAVMGAGLSTIYPPENAQLAEDISRHGALISEYAMEVAPSRGSFPTRNRIIAGLTLGVLVVEAGQRSGALITARLASEYNREVFAVPGRIDRPEFTAGVNGMIRDSQAKLVTGLDDILDELDEVGQIMRQAQAGVADPSIPTTADPADGPAATSSTEQVVLDALHRGIEDLEALALSTRMAAGDLTATLTRLQLRGRVKCLPGNRFVCRSERVSK